MEHPQPNEHQDTSVRSENMAQSLVTGPANSLQPPAPNEQAGSSAEHLERARLKLRDFGRSLTTALEKPKPVSSYAQKLIRKSAQDVNAEKLCHSVRKRLVQYNTNNAALERMKAHFTEAQKRLSTVQTRNVRQAEQLSELVNKLEAREDALVALASAFKDYAKQFGPGILISFKSEKEPASKGNAPSKSQAPPREGISEVDMKALFERAQAQAAARVLRPPVLKLQRGPLTFCMDGSEQPVRINLGFGIINPQKRRERCSPTNDIWSAIAEEDRDQL